MKWEGTLLMKTGTEAYQILFHENSLIEAENSENIKFRSNLDKMQYFCFRRVLLIRTKPHNIQLLYRFYSHVLLRPLLL